MTRAHRNAGPPFVLTALLVLGACAHRDQPSGAASAAGGAGAKPLAELQRDFVELRFGMFLHFGILTYTGAWSKPNLDIKLFNPTRLDPGQWADAAVSAKMKYGVLTTKHHDGFALWPSKAGSCGSCRATVRSRRRRS